MWKARATKPEASRPVPYGWIEVAYQSSFRRQRCYATRLRLRLRACGEGAFRIMARAVAPPPVGTASPSGYWPRLGNRWRAREHGFRALVKSENAEVIDLPMFAAHADYSARSSFDVTEAGTIRICHKP
jgi:hypothetical protein